jgi:hypothetical protein
MVKLRSLLPSVALAGVTFGSLSVGSTVAVASCDGALHLKCPQINAAQSQTAVPSGNQQYGFQDNTLSNKEVPRGTVLGRLQGVGAHYLRQPMSWQSYEPRPGVFNATYFNWHDRDYQDLVARGIHPVITLLGTPNWAVSATSHGLTSSDGRFRCDNSGAPCLAPPDLTRTDVVSEWQHFVRVVTKRYPKAGAIEVWNEPNIQAFWMQNQDPVLYAHLLATTTQAVHGVNPQMPVLTGSTANFYGTSTSKSTAADVFLRTIYKTVGASAFNAIGWHYYPCTDTSSEWTAQATKRLNQLRAVRNNFNDSTKPFWITEMGATTSGNDAANCNQGPFTEQKQSNFLGTMLDWAKGQNANHHDLPVVLLYTLFNTDQRQVMTTPNPVGRFEYGIVAYTYDQTTDRTTVQSKVAYANVQCKMHSTC